MNVADLFAALSLGELSNMHIGLDGAGDIEEAEKPRIIRFANQTLTDLHTRFSNKTDYVKLELSDTLQRYRLHPRHAVSDTDVTNTAARFILDSAEEPFLGRIIAILGVRDEYAEDEDDRDVPLNDRTHPAGVLTLSYDTLFVKAPVAGKILTVEYQANHAKLSAIPEPTEEIELAPLLEEALVARVAGKVYASMGGEDAMSKAQVLFNEYERICALAETKDVLNVSSSETHDRLEDRGWK